MECGDKKGAVRTLVSRNACSSISCSGYKGDGSKVTFATEAAGSAARCALVVEISADVESRSAMRFSESCHAESEGQGAAVVCLPGVGGGGPSSLKYLHMPLLGSAERLADIRAKHRDSPRIQNVRDMIGYWLISRD